MSIKYSLKSQDGVITKDLTGLDIQKLAAAGKISGHDEIAKTGTDEWIPAYRLKGFDFPKPEVRKNDKSTDLKQCPYCAEDVQKNAIKCKHCGEWFKEEKTENAAFDRVLCKDESCIGILDTNSICTQCGRTAQEALSEADFTPTGGPNLVPSQYYNQPPSKNWISCLRCGGHAFGGRGCLLIGLIHCCPK